MIHICLHLRKDLTLTYKPVICKDITMLNAKVLMDLTINTLFGTLFGTVCLVISGLASRSLYGPHK